MDIKSFYLNTPVDHFEYMWLSLDLIQEEIISKYNLDHIANNGWIQLN